MKKVSIVLISFFLFTTCTKEDMTPGMYPLVLTSAVQNITTTGAFFQAEIVYTSTEIVDHGFIWSIQPVLVLEDATRISLGSRTGTGSFEVEMEGSLDKGVVYYVRSYAISNGYTVYGNREKFELP